MNTQPQQLAERIAAIAPHSRIILFGSRARGSHTPFSDIDIAVEGVSDSADWLTIRRLADIDDETAFPTLLKIDLMRMEEADDALRRSITAQGKVLYEHS